MRILLFGATGMVGQGVLRECLLDPEVEEVLSIGRKLTGKTDPKLKEILLRELDDLTEAESEIHDFDACIYCIGSSSAGQSEKRYIETTYSLTENVADTLIRLNPNLNFVFGSAAGADPTEKNPVFWAKVKGRTEKMLSEKPFKGVYVFRPMFIQPLHGIESRTGSYRKFYKFARPFMPLLHKLIPNYMTTTEQLGKAMVNVAKNGAEKTVLESSDFKTLG
ncbi:NAD-dependent epimerase/dehydratase family protein [Selenomonadales bacterium OttesenSCG-928-I06]|nr:NAD-dependent epimerase/dehydratase family protein [Selenomonadales bacterium OttesenSCG-928-I06]